MKKQNPPPGVSEDATGGLWYYVWLKPNWVLLAMKEEHAQHPAFWGEKILPRIGFHYKLNATLVDRLFTAFRALPRGRVMLVNYGQSFRLAHGGDFPTEIGEDFGIKQVRRAFGLVRRRVELEQQEHETMDGQHMDALQRVVGRIPY